MDTFLVRRCLVLLLLSACLFMVTGTEEDSNSPEGNTEDSNIVTESSADSELTEAEEIAPRDPTLVTVLQGQLRGYREEANNNKEFYSFRGVPFGKPPVDELRFQPPEDAPAWEGVLEAAEDPPLCPQMSQEYFVTRKFTAAGQEDCLYLNVFSPMHQVSLEKPLLPVMVFIHGGGYIFGHAGQYQPYGLMTQDIVLVVIQYRLGTLGYLSTEDDVAPGNMGILDQTLALKWVQDNVYSFGGNPVQITIFGESAGSSSVHLQILSHTSLGYFTRAIMQSGTAQSSWALATNHREVTYYIAKQLDCHNFADVSTSNCSKEEADSAAYNGCLVDELPSETILQCLQGAPMETLAESATWFFKFNMFPLMMGPRVHPNLIMQDPNMLLQEHRFKKMDIMMGVTRDEGAMITFDVFGNEGMRSYIRFKFEELGPVALDFGPEDVAPLNQTIKIFDYYAGSPEFDRQTADNLTAMFGDRLMWYPTDTTAFVHSTDHMMAKKKKSTFVYEFAYRGEVRLMGNQYDLDVGEHWVSHGDDIVYLFGVVDESKKPSFSGRHLRTEADIKVAELMVKLWTNFAATGNPTPEGGDIAHWERYDGHNPRVFIIDAEPRMEETDRKKQIREFWRALPLKMNMVLFPDSVVNLTRADSTDSKPPAEAQEQKEIKKDEL